MHILYLHQYFCPPGGSGNNRSYDLARRWVEMGHKVSVLTSPAYFPESLKQAQHLYKEDVDGIELYVIDINYSHMMGFWQRIRAWLFFYREALSYGKRLPNEFDLVYASSTPLTMGELGRKLAGKWGVPFVFETVDVWPDVPVGMGILKNKALISWLNRRTNRIYNDAAAVVALSEGMRAQILSHGVPPDKVHVVHNGTDTTQFAYAERAFGRRKKRAIYTGTVGKANGLDFLVRVAQILEERGRSDIELKVLGNGNDLRRVKRLAEEAGVSNLLFAEKVPKEAVREELLAADLGLVIFAEYPVLEANSANKFFDYLSTGLPVLLNYEGWQAEYLRKYDCGKAIQQGDVDGFAGALVEMIDHPESLAEMGRRGREMVMKHFDRAQLAQQLLELFDQILESPQPARQ